jgi:cysteinyl-tRNA synthetase
VRVDDEKMSKSLGNFFTVREVLSRYQPEVVRFFILRAHYRSPLNYSDQHLDDAKSALARLYIALKGREIPSTAIDWNGPYAQRFKDAMDDDFNTPEAVAVLFDLASEANRTGSLEDMALLKSMGGLLGLLQRDPQQHLQDESLAGDAKFTPERIEEMIQQRLSARAARNFAEADRIRKDLSDADILLEDGPDGTSWRRK